MFQELIQRKCVFLSTASESHLSIHKCIFSVKDIGEALKELDIFPFHGHKLVFYF